PDLVVLDLHFALPEDRLLPEDKTGIEGKRGMEEIRRTQGLLILERLRRDYPNLPVVLLTTTDAEFDRPKDPLIYFCENEVVDSRTLAAEITRALELQSAAQEGPVFWGKSPAMAAVRRQIGVLSRSPLPVLIEGETGTVTRLGDVRARPAAPRLVAATNLDLEALVREGRFRHDLYMRLNPATRLRVPALRERPEDLPDLVRFAFLDALRAGPLRPLVRAYLARYPTPDDFVEENDAVVFGKPQASRARRDAFT